MGCLQTQDLQQPVGVIGGLCRAVVGYGVQRPFETLGERRAAAGPLANVVSYALTLVQAGSPDRGALFLLRAAERIDGGREPRSPEAVNLLALADLIRFGEGRTYSGKIERIAIEGSDA